MEEEDPKIEIAVTATTATQLLAMVRVLLAHCDELGGKQPEEVQGWIRRIMFEGERRLLILQSNLDQLRAVMDPEKKGERDVPEKQA